MGSLVLCRPKERKLRTVGNVSGTRVFQCQSLHRLFGKLRSIFRIFGQGKVVENNVFLNYCHFFVFFFV